MEAREPEWRHKINVVWIVDSGQMHVPRADQLHELVSYDFKVSFAEPPANCGNILNHGVERIVHALRGVRVGIALGGGAARGMAHLGVLKALEQNGIIVDMIAGTSAGAMTGTIYASGMDVDYAVDRFVKDLTPSWLFRRMRSGGYWYLLHKYRRGQFDPMLRRYLSDLRFEQLPIPMNTITVDLVSGEPKIRDRGDAVDGILESINLPGLSAPICRNGQALVDGGLVNNVPADVLVSKGCNFRDRRQRHGQTGAGVCQDSSRFTGTEIQDALGDADDYAWLPRTKRQHELGGSTARRPGYRPGRDELRSQRVHSDERTGRHRPRNDRGIHRENSHLPRESG